MLPCKNLPLIEMCWVAEVVSALTNAVSSPHVCTHQRSLTASTQHSPPRDFLWPKKRLSTSEERELVNKSSCSSPFTGQLKGVFHRLFQNSSVGLVTSFPSLFHLLLSLPVFPEIPSPKNYLTSNPFSQVGLLRNPT